ncbi:MAG: hypothetical protein EAX96_03655 [Candidatus Lokiarchaeota archaeon]|nr:hypothetical protein [Candidatus Lokiarchaeota archaeon]
MAFSEDPIVKFIQLIQNLKTFMNVDTDPILNEFKDLMQDIYDVFTGLEQYSRKRRLAILKLAHLYPNSLTTVELRMIMEYSDRTSLSYVRNELKDLENDKIITIKRYPDKKLPFQIRINHKHRLMKVLISLTRFGIEYKEMIEEMVEKNE